MPLCPTKKTVEMTMAVVMGGLDVQLYCCSGAMNDDVASGELVVAYNVLGSYAAQRPDREAFEIVLPLDHTVLMQRTALIPIDAPAPELAQESLEHMLMRAHGPEAEPPSEPLLGQAEGIIGVRRIPIDTGLLVVRDQMTSKAFLAEWDSAVFQGAR